MEVILLFPLLPTQLWINLPAAMTKQQNIPEAHPCVMGYMLAEKGRGLEGMFLTIPCRCTSQVDLLLLQGQQA